MNFASGTSPCQEGLDCCIGGCIEQLKAFDDGAWNAVYKEHHDQLSSLITFYLAKYGLSIGLVDDVAQATWITAALNIQDFTFENTCKFKLWLRAIALNHIRNLGRTVPDEQSLDEVEDQENSESILLEYFLPSTVCEVRPVEKAVIRREQLVAIDAAMQYLSPRDREILLQYLWGVTPRELARIYKLEPQSISKLLIRAKSIIRAALSE